MKLKKGFLFLVFLISSGLTKVSAQEAVSASGGYNKSGGGSISYSVNFTNYINISGSIGSLSSGVQQPYEIYTIGLKKINQSYLFTIFPNPSQDILKLRIEGLTIENLFYQLVSIEGVQINNKIIAENETEISMLKLTPGIYFLNLFQNNKVIKSFKIIKN